MEYFLGRGEKWKEDDMSKIASKNPTKNPSKVLKRLKQPKIIKIKMKRNRKSVKVTNCRKLEIEAFSNSLHSNHRSSTKAKEIDWRRKKRWFNYSMKYLIFLLILVQEFDLGATGNVPIMSTRIVETRYGKLQGMIYPMDHAKHLKPVEVFLGVPYATPPVRSNRFSPTRTPSPWEGVRIADKMGPVCPQKLPGIKNETAALEKMPKGRLEYLKRLLPYLSNQSEDCLYLNIYAPAQIGAEGRLTKHPVLVFIHGESYDWNSGNPYDGSVLASYADLVVVTLNYRLGILGFLNANVAPHLKARVANYGLMDQIAALHWIQQNIGLFGGDPQNVTLLGHGTGAACIHFLMISPTVMPGLFHRSILLSGSALSSWALVEDPVSFATKLARQVNCTLPQDLLREHEKIVDCLREVPLEDLQKADVVAPTYLSTFGPSVDGVVIKTDFQKDMLTYFVPGDPVSSFTGPGMAKSKRSEASMLGIPTTGTNRYDLLFGVVTSEALFRFSAADVSNGFEGERRDKIIRTYVRNAYTYHLSEIFYTVVNEYTDWERTVMHPINTRDAAIAALGDAQFVAPLIRTGDLLSSRGAVNSGGPGTKTWFYVFDYQTKDGDYPQRMGTAHGEELPYVFGAPLIDGFNHFPKNYTKSEVTLSEAVIIYLSNFVRTGNPNDHQRTDGSWNTRERSRFRNIVWDEYDSVHQKYLEMGMKPRMKNHFRAHQLSVWLRLIPELHRAGMEDVVARHNLFRNHNDHDLYDGIVRPDPLSRTNYGLRYNTEGNQDFVYSSGGVLANTGRRHHHGGNDSYAAQPVTTPETLLTTCVSVINSYPAATHHLGHQNTTDPLANLEAAGYAAYSTALSVTIAIGCSLLILNVLIFAGVYYQRDKTRLEVKSLQQSQRGSVNYDVKPGHYHIGGGSVIVDLEQDTANMILCQNQQRDSGGNILLCQNQGRFPSTATLSRTASSHCVQSATGGTMTIKKPTPDISRNNPDLGIRNPDSHNPDIVKNNPSVNSAGILMNANKRLEMNHIPSSKSSSLGHMATLPKNMTFCNNVAPGSEGLVSPPNGSATMHMSLPRPPPPPIRNPPESQPLLPPKQHPPGSLRVPTAAMNEMRV